MKLFLFLQTGPPLLPQHPPAVSQSVSRWEVPPLAYSSLLFYSAGPCIGLSGPRASKDPAPLPPQLLLGVRLACNSPVIVSATWYPEL